MTPELGGLGILGSQFEALTLAALGAGTLLLDDRNNEQVQPSSRQLQTGKSLQETGSVELLDANAEACEELLQQYINRLVIGRSTGWWQTAVYVAAESEAAQQSVIGALRSKSSGDTTSLDPFRNIPVPAHVLHASAG